MSARHLDLGFAPVLALRVTYLGELGYELHVPVEYALHLYEKLWAAGERFGIANAGYRAVNSLRLEKHYLAWGSDITPDYNPYEAGLGFCVASGKGDYVARSALADVKAAGPRQKLAWFSAPPEIDLFGGEIVLAEGRVLGRVSERGLRIHGRAQPAVRLCRRSRACASRVRGGSDGRAISRDTPLAAAVRSRPPRHFGVIPVT